MAGFWKQIKRRLRLRKRWLTFASLIVLLGLAATAQTLWNRELPTDRTPDPLARETWSGADDDRAKREAERRAANENALSQIERTGRQTVEAVHRKAYICGEETFPLGTKSTQELRNLLAEHSQWEAEFRDPDTVVLTETVDDLSSACKQTAHFGLDEEDRLTLFDGPPKDAKAVRTFFQLNIEHMESSLPREYVEQLRQGIRVSDMAEFNSVLSTFSDFAEEEAEEVTTPGGRQTAS